MSLEYNYKVDIDYVKLRGKWKTFSESIINGPEIDWLNTGDFVTDGEGNFFFVCDTTWISGITITYINGTIIKEGMTLYSIGSNNDEERLFDNAYNKLRQYKREYNLKQLKII
jgi:hypothetical protein